MLWIDSYAHVNAIRTGTSFDLIPAALNGRLVNRIYEPVMDTLNLRDNRGLSSSLSLPNKLLLNAALLLNVPFYAGKGVDELLQSMHSSGINHSVLVNLEPFSNAEETLEIASRSEGRFSAIVNLKRDENTVRFEERFFNAVELGARGIATHPPLEKIHPTDPHYDQVASLCAQANVPMVCRTGVTPYAGGIDPAYGEILNFEKLVGSHPGTTFVMTHSNLTGYERAIDFAKRHSNVYLDTVWQTAASIEKMIQSIGAERVLFGSDWPILGNQQKVQRRILSKLKIAVSSLEKIAGLNAANLYRIDVSELGISANSVQN